MRSKTLSVAMAATLFAGGLVGAPGAALAAPHDHHHGDRHRRGDRHDRGDHHDHHHRDRGWRGDHRHWSGGYRYEHHGWNRGYYYRRDHDNGAALGAGVLGFALGAAIAGSASQQHYARAHMGDPQWIAYCGRKYRSFDPSTGTYLGYDGYRHYCR